MDTTQIIEEIDAEIRRLQIAKALLYGSHTTGKPAKPSPKKPGRRKMSAAGRARIAAAQKGRWAKAKKESKPRKKRLRSSPTVDRS